LNRHPYVVLFHIGFRAAAIIVYLFCGWFSDGFVTSFVFTVILLSLDFWTVKNITGLQSYDIIIQLLITINISFAGRILVGLRWWSYVDSEGQSHWVYEARKVDLLMFYNLKIIIYFCVLLGRRCTKSTCC
jgi:hypothetical protein